MPFARENHSRQPSRYLEPVLSRLPRLSWRSLTFLGAAALLVLVCFLAGSWYGQRQAAKYGPGARKILYYVDPMNPAHTSPEPGLAPCGMKMEPVFADEVGQYPESSLAPGTVRVTPRKQQLIGVRVAPVEKTSHTHTFRALGRVAVDERLIYRLNSAVDGWIREVGNNSTGSVVKKGDVLAIFYSPVFLAAQQAYIYALSSLDRYQTVGSETQAQTQINRAGIQQNVDSLRNLGMGDQQIKELEKTRKFTENIQLVAPATSFVLARNISAGQRFDKGAEWYRLADLSRVWVLVDLYENEAGFIRPGERVSVRHPYQKKVVQGVVSDVLPQFDPTSRTLKVRLEVENPDFALRPDMFMDVDFPATLPETVSVPADAILDSGLRKTVFVDRGEGFFEPRNVETGWRLGDRVQVLKGLKPGEKIVVSGNFLLDSESRMKLAASGMVGDIGSDVVCSKLVDERKAGTEGRTSLHQGKTFYFCSEQCKELFEEDPERFAGSVIASQPAGLNPPSAAAHTVAASQPRGQEPIVAAPPPDWRPPVIPPAAPPAAKTAASHSPSMPPPQGEPSTATPASSLTTRSPPTATGQEHPQPEARPECHDTAADHQAQDHQAEMASATSSDVVCGMQVDERQAGAGGRASLHQGKTFYFCSEHCKELFDKDPERFAGADVANQPAGFHPPPAAHTTTTSQPGAQEPIVAAPPPDWQPPVISPAAPVEAAVPPPAVTGQAPPQPEAGHQCHGTTEEQQDQAMAPPPAVTGQEQPQSEAGHQCPEAAGEQQAPPLVPPPEEHQQSHAETPPAPQNLAGNPADRHHQPGPGSHGESCHD